MKDLLTEKIIGAAIAVHRELGPGFLKSIYEQAMAMALTEAGIAFRRQHPVPVLFRGRLVGEHRLDFLIESAVVVELKAIKALEDIPIATVRSYFARHTNRPGPIDEFRRDYVASASNRR